MFLLCKSLSSLTIGLKKIERLKNRGRINVNVIESTKFNK